MTEDFVREAILAELRRRLDASLNENMESFKKTMEETIRKEVGHIALTILSRYEIARDKNNLVITVKQ